jgi:hypothetical protein
MVSRHMLWQTHLPPALVHKVEFAYQYGRWPPGVEWPPTRAPHAAMLPARAGICVLRQLLLPCVCRLLARGADAAEGPRGSSFWTTPVDMRCPRADSCRCWGTRGAIGTRAVGAPTRHPCRGIAMDNLPPCGYDARMRASERVRRRRERLAARADQRSTVGGYAEGHYGHLSRVCGE